MCIRDSKWLEYIPQLDSVTGESMRIEGGMAIPSDVPGLGIDWDWKALADNSLINMVIT